MKYNFKAQEEEIVTSYTENILRIQAIIVNYRISFKLINRNSYFKSRSNGSDIYIFNKLGFEARRKIFYDAVRYICGVIVMGKAKGPAFPLRML